MEAPTRTGWVGAAQAARDLVDVTDNLLRLCEEAQEDDAIGKRVDRQALGDIGVELGEARVAVDAISAHVNEVIKRLGDKDAA